MQKFSSIEQFRNVRRAVEMKAQFVGLDANGDVIVNREAILPVLDYEGTVKMHGCCSSIRIDNDGNITCQSREREITPENDNYGFARFIADCPKNRLIEAFGTNVVIHGEWAGKGIQDTVAINQVPKFWAIFCVQTLDENRVEFMNLDLLDDVMNKTLVLNDLRIFSNRQFGVFNIQINFNKPEEAINEMNRLTLEVEKQCPVGKFFGISGVGEGIVWRPLDPEYNLSKFVFKVKGDEHSKSKVKKLATVDVEKVNSINEFVEKHVSEGRLEQGYRWLAENNIPQIDKSTGDFIRWVAKDVVKEEGDELTANGFTEKDINAALSKKARNWYMKRMNA